MLSCFADFPIIRSVNLNTDVRSVAADPMMKLTLLQSFEYRGSDVSKYLCAPLAHCGCPDLAFGMPSVPILAARGTILALSGRPRARRVPESDFLQSLGRFRDSTFRVFGGTNSLNSRQCLRACLLVTFCTDV